MQAAGLSLNIVPLRITPAFPGTLFMTKGFKRLPCLKTRIISTGSERSLFTLTELLVVFNSILHSLFQFTLLMNSVTAANTGSLMGLSNVALLSMKRY